MKVFISWSGDRSKAIARTLSDLMPDILQEVQPWMSDDAIASGSRWADEVRRELDTSGFGILCLTPENIAAPWLLFEAGALSKSVKESRVVPFRYELAVADVAFPLAQYQGTSADKEGTLKLISSINASLKVPLPEKRLLRLFEIWWPAFNQRLLELPVPSEPADAKRTDRDLLDEAIDTVRSISGKLPRITDAEMFLLQLNRRLDDLYHLEYKIEMRSGHEELPDYQDLQKYIGIHTRLQKVFQELIEFQGFPKRGKYDSISTGNELESDA